MVARQRSISPDSSKPSKKLKVGDVTQAKNFESYFSPELFSKAQNVKDTYKNSRPYKHAVIDTLFQNDFLVKVKDECVNQLNFTEKETDIYKVYQTGDLASLSYLENNELAKLENLLLLRDALYSQEFRKFVRSVTGCGPLSCTKIDMSVNSYKKGCHLLNHDDVIGSRRVSYILYMPLPHDERWRPEWGGALELYDVKAGPNNMNEPVAIPTISIPPSWNQFIFFEIQPGKSFHSVEEVVVDEGEDAKQRLSISGWFHAAQEGEEDYEAEQSEKTIQSSLEQLTTTSTTFNDYDEEYELSQPNATLSESHHTFLSQYLNPIYLFEKNLRPLVLRFIEESSLELHSILKEDLASKLESELRIRDVSDKLDRSRQGIIPRHHSGLSENWLIKGPPHKWRYCTLSQEFLDSSSTADATLDGVLKNLQTKLFPSAAFRAWLAFVTSLIPMRFAAEVRRFRPGLDYTLATSAAEGRLDVVLELTASPASSSKEKAKETELPLEESWESGNWGGWECYMAPHDGEEDAAIYRSKVSIEKEGGISTENGNDDEDESDTEDGTLLTVQPGFNRLLLVLRDEGVMHFVKYVSSAAHGSRWDVSCEFEVGMLQPDDDD